MKNRRFLIVALAVAVIVIGAGFVALRNVGGGGQDRTFDVTISGGTMAPDTITVKQGDRVTLNVSVDRTEEIHLHGYDILETIAAGTVGQYRFTADKSGSYAIEIETTGTTIGHLIVNP